MEALKNDTVFFLGAGFSKAAGAPLQSEIMKMVLDYEGYNYGNPVADFKNRLNAFLTDAFHLTSSISKRKFTLEDFYTPIDKCISERMSFRGYSVEYIQQIRNELSTLISIVIDNELTAFDGDTTFLDDFCDYIIRSSSGSSNKKKCSIITTNWDILLDRRIFEKLNRTGSTIDFGTHVTGLGNTRNDQIIPAMTALARGHNTVKIYKIHGSLNWLKCPSCDRLYVHQNTKVGILEQELSISCRFCEDQFTMPNGVNGGYSLQPQIIYPTFLKDLKTSHFSNIWNNVSRDLSETKCIVFIGYSFQQADFEIRQLLARRLPDDCKIIQVDNGQELEQSDPNYSTSAQSRYRNFFGAREYQYFGCGAQEYINNHLLEL